MKFRHISIALAAALAITSPLLAESSTTLHVNSVEQSLSTALNAFAKEAKLQLIVDSNLIEGKKAPTLQGELSLKEAFEKLLKGSGLEAIIQGDSVMIQKITTAHNSTLEAIAITASADASAEGVMPSFSGGQVARGGKVGILGNKDIMETPFTVTSYTNELIQNQQANSVGDVLLNDPSVRVARGFGNFQESYFIRGFILNSDSVAYNGLYGLLPRQYISAELFERVEVLRGASAFLNGASPGGDGLGGAINLLPKRAPNESLARVTVGTENGEQGLASIDVAERFGENKNTGVRINAAHKEGGTSVDNENVELNLFSIGWDYRNDNLRLSADVGHQEHRIKETRTNVTLSGVTVVPDAPSGSSNWAQPWSYSNETDTFGSFRGEYDLSSSLTAWLAAGFRRSEEANSLANLTVTDGTTGAGYVTRFDNTREDAVNTAETGIRGKAETLGVGHEWVFSANYFELKKKAAYKWDYFNHYNTNLYNPTSYSLPAWSGGGFSGNDLDDPALTGKTRLTSFALGDTLSLIDNTLLLTVGVRQQKIDEKGYDYNTGILSSSYVKDRVSPITGIVYKLTNHFSIYGNYVEGLSQGGSAPSTAANYGESLSPYVSKQKEVGVKYDSGSLGATLALFSTTKPRGVVNASNVYVEEGKDRHEGAELTAYGELMEGLRVLGGITLLDAKQVSTNNVTTDGKDVIGVPEKQVNVGFEWDVPGVSGLSLDARLIVTDEVYADAANTLKVPSWERVDVGARYVTVMDKHMVTWRARILNVADTNYWASSGGYPDNGYLVLGAPRTFMLNVSVDF
ncbi:TonB-dependent siderophore receptor [Sulfurospirillum arsenophilum]|uniref:TonB-dependent siderophore receptor n=1 Tax=Sulfurospirillum arsenophilum TaxID=56698 RepID=UPI000693C75F|nr:TonB-dependent siderophore receptor [Sulfurospirillum arsenophilum]